jgi:hypothetical protein
VPVCVQISLSLQVHTSRKSLECMAGTTGLEPATSAVTVSQNPITYRNNGQWMAPFSANRHTGEQLLWP